MKRKRANGKRKPKQQFVKEAIESEVALVPGYGLEGINSEYAAMGDEAEPSETNMRSLAIGKSVADQRAEGNANSLCKKPTSVLGGISKFASNIAAGTSRNNSFKAKLNSRVEAETQRAEINTSDRETDLEIEGAVNGRMQNYPNSLREMIVNIIKDMSKGAGSLSNLSKSLVDTPVSEEPVLQLPKEKSSPFHEDPDYKEQELKAALAVIKKIMKLDAAGPFNIPVDPIALGIPDYFDVIKTPMDFGTIHNRLEKGLKYMNAADVFKDVQYIWDNCEKYNKKGDHILELMKRVKASFMRYWIAAGLQKEQPQTINESPITRRSRRRKDCQETPSTENHDSLHPNMEYSTQVISNQPFQTNVEASQLPQISSQPRSSPQEDCTIIASTNIQKKRKHRGPTRCLKLLNTVGQVTILTNEFGQPIGPDTCKLTSFLGFMARNGNLAPLTYRNWSKMPVENKENMWQKVLDKFEIDPCSRSWVLKSIGRKWKNFKALLKATRFDTHATDEERLADRDERVLPDQWSALVSQWKSEKWQNLSATNKAVRARLKFCHTTGKKSFARICEEERAKRPDGKDLSLEELFILTHTRKNGEPVNEEAAALISQLRESTVKQVQSSDNRSIPEDDATTQVTGQSRKGGVPFGLGPSHARIGIRAEALKIVSEKNKEVLEMKDKLVSVEQTCAQIAAQKDAEALEMKEKLVSVEQTCAQMAAQMAAMVSMMATMQKSSPGETVLNVVANNGLISSGLPDHSEPTPTSHPAAPSRQIRGRKKKR